MKMPRFKLRYLKVYFYLLHSMVHWQEREDAISEILDRVQISTSGKPLRIIDVGCGPGLLVDIAIKKGFSYLGMDTDRDSIDYCRKKYQNKERISFTTSTIPSHEIAIQSGDIIVLNGVLHHVYDETAKELLSYLSQAEFVIIADHYLDKTVGSWPKFLQKLDRGKYVRDYSFFRSIDGYRPVQSLVFPIKIFSFIFWMYFCVAYTPEAKGVIEDGM
jgi:SAM-dependent methyltransferase